MLLNHDLLKGYVKMHKSDEESEQKNPLKMKDIQQAQMEADKCKQSAESVKKVIENHDY